jgi:hypothetical protein
MKNNFNKILFVVLVLLISNISRAQHVKMYAHITDKTLIPQKENTNLGDKIKFKSANSKMKELLDKYKPIKFQKAFPTAKTDWLREVYLIECDDKEFGKKLKENFKEGIPLVEFLDEPVLTAEAYTPNDYHPYQTYLDLIRAKEAYNYCRDLPKEPLALTDTYFEAHEDLDFIDIWGSNNNSTDYHGIHVAGFMGAITDNNVGIASIGYNTRLMASSNWASDNEVLLLAQAGYRVINCSWINTCSYNSAQDALYNEIRNDWDALVIFGAGNKHCGGGSAYCFPASYDVNISVTAITHGTNPDWHEQVPGDVNTAYQHNDKVDICAPGYNVYTTDLMAPNGYNTSGNYSSGWGTSYSAPLVTATLGVILTINPCLSADEAEAILLNNTDQSLYNLPQNSPYIGLLGEGRLDVAAAVEAAVLSATTTIDNQTLNINQEITANYGIDIYNATVPKLVEVNFKARKEITIFGEFQIISGAACNIEVNPNFVFSCN